MAGVGAVAASGAKALGARFSIVGVVPSALVVVFLLAINVSNLYPWASPGEVGVAAVLQRTETLSGGDGVLLVFGILLFAVLLRPFQVTLVRLLEGYWYAPWSDGPKALMVERHNRRYSLASLRATLPLSSPQEQTFEAVASYAVDRERLDRLARRAERVLADYPPGGRVETMMPTVLGNILRRAERTAGERYGLDTVHTYPRLYPHLSKQLDKEIGQQLDLVDTGASVATALGICTIVAVPLVWRVDSWSLLPILLALLAVVAARGSRTAARHYGTLLCTAFDLHRFQMIEALRLPLPSDAQKEAGQNKRLHEFFRDGNQIIDSQWKYDQPSQSTAALSNALAAILVSTTPDSSNKPDDSGGANEKNDTGG